MTDDQYNLLEELLKVDQDLSSWEVEFIEGLSHKGRDYVLSERQFAKLSEISEKHL